MRNFEELDTNPKRKLILTLKALGGQFEPTMVFQKMYLLERG